MPKKFQVIRDTREKDNHGWFYEEDQLCLGTVTTKVDIGDYTIQGLEDKLCIERKASVKEFYQNFNEKRFMKELYAMKEFPHRYLIFEFDFTNILRFPELSSIPRNIWNPDGSPKQKANWKKFKSGSKSMRTFTGTILTRFDIPIIYAGSASNAEAIAYDIMKQAAKLYETLL